MVCVCVCKEKKEIYCKELAQAIEESDKSLDLPGEWTNWRSMKAMV